MKKLLLGSLLLASSSFAYDIGVNTSYDYVGVNQTNSANMILGDNKPENHGWGLEVYYSGDCLLTNNKTIKNYISYKQTKISDITKYEVFMGINKEYPLNDFALYSGLVAGYGFLKYDNNPLGSTSIEDKRANSFLYGLQFGTKYKLKSNENLFFKLEGRYIRSDYDANLESSGVVSTITHKDASSVSFGIGYSF